MSSREFSEWQAYYAQEPFGEYRADLRMGILASLIANMFNDPKKRTKNYTPDDFMPQFGGAQTQTVSEQVQLVHLLQEAFGGVITTEE